MREVGAETGDGMVVDSYRWCARISATWLLLQWLAIKVVETCIQSMSSIFSLCFDRDKSVGVAINLLRCCQWCRHFGPQRHVLLINGTMIELVLIQDVLLHYVA